MAKPNLLLLGATGFVGGTLLDRLVDTDNYNITMLVRSEDKAAKYRELNLGLNPVVGSTDDAKLLEDLASEADVLTQASRAHGPAILSTILTGLKKRHSKTDVVPRFFYTSGSALLSDDAQGLHGEQKPTSDLNPAALFDPPNPLVNFMKYIATDMVKADEEVYIKSYILAPPLIFGEPDNRFVRAGIQSPHSSVWPVYFGPVLASGKAGYVGKGANLANAVHVEDLADLFLLILNQESTVGHGNDAYAYGFYFTAPIELSMRELVGAIGEVLVALGEVDDPTVSAYTDEEIKLYLKPPMDRRMGSNTRSSNERSTSIGWKPKYTTKESVLENTKAALIWLTKQQSEKQF